MRLTFVGKQWFVGVGEGGVGKLLHFATVRATSQCLSCRVSCQSQGQHLSVSVSD